jgi:predicted DNA-binding transcriptional regulator
LQGYGEQPESEGIIKEKGSRKNLSKNGSNGIGIINQKIMAKSNYDNLGISKKTLEGSGINIDQLKIYKLLNDRQDRIIISEVKKLLSEQNREIFARLNKIDIKIGDINKEIIEIHRQLAIHEKDISKIKKHLKLE